MDCEDDNFILYMEKLIDFSATIYKLNHSGDYVASNINPNLTELMKYKIFYLGRENKKGTRHQEEHKEKMTDIYNKCKQIMMEKNEYDEFIDWFKTKNFYLEYPLKRNTFRFTISRAFTRACMISDEINKKNDKMNKKKSNNETNDDEDYTLIVYPDMYIFYLFHIFLECTDVEKEKNKINEYLNQIREILQLKDEEEPDYKDMYTELFECTKDAAHELGYDIDKKNKPANMKLVIKKFKETIKNPTTKKTFRTIISKLTETNSNPENIGQIFQEISKNMVDATKEDPEGIKEAINAKA